MSQLQSQNMRGESSSVRRTGSRRSWTTLEERTLLNAFKDIIAQGWKTPNGYRAGFIQQLEARLKLAMPGTDLRGDPHILSKYGSWKKTYREVNEVVGKTGMGWNSSTHTVRAEPGYWDHIEAYNPDLAYVCEKPFPYYETWVEIFGRDGATGNGAIDFNDAPNNGGAGNGLEEVEETDTGSPPANPNPTNTQSQSETPVTNSVRSHSKGKRKRNDDVTEIVDAIGKMWGEATEALKDVAHALRTEVNTRVDVQHAANRKRLFDAIKALPLTLTRMELVRATRALCKQQDEVDVFFEVPEEARCDMVYLALEGAPI